MNQQRLAFFVEVVALATLYALTARLGLRLDAVSGFAALVWPPTGIALWALLLSRGRLWPGVLIGAVVANVLTGASFPVALGIGLGNTLEAAFAALVLRRIPGFRFSLDRLPDALGLIILAAAISSTISATIGVASLALGGLVSIERFGPTWRAWWLGDCIGDLLVAPMLLVWATSLRRLRRPYRVLEAVALGTCLVAAGALIFGRAATGASAFGEPYMLFPLLIWAALRFGQPGGVAATFVISCAAIWGTALGHGPFIRPALHESLLALQIFMGVMAATFLVVGSSRVDLQACKLEYSIVSPK